MERIKIGFNWNRYERLTDHLEDSARYANTVLIPLLKTYDLPTDIENVITACNQKEHFYKLLKAQAVKDVKNKFLKEAALKEASEIFEEVRHKMRNDCIRTAERKYLDLQDDNLIVIKHLIESDCDIVLEDPEDIKRHKQLDQICRDIEKFCEASQIPVMRFSQLIIITPDHIEPNNAAFPLIKA